MIAFTAPDLPALARGLHIAAIVHWIGGLAFVTFVILPNLLQIDASERLALFDRIERRFAGQARISTLLAGATGFYLVDVFGHWRNFAEARFWWLHAMLALWTLFTIMLFVAEPLFLHAWFDRYAQRDPDAAFRLALRGHRVLSVLAFVTVIGAGAGAHGMF